MDEALAYLIENGLAWVQEQRDRHRPDALALKPQERQVFEPFFEAEVLDEVRFKSVPRIENPGFYRLLAAMGRPLPLDFAASHGITFGDTVLLSERYLQSDASRLSLLFHEMVHVVQYGLLGMEGFLRVYVTGWAENGFEYRAIPLERDAYDLQDRFEENAAAPFSVHDEVARRLASGA